MTRPATDWQLSAFRVAAHIPRALWWPVAQLASLVLAARPAKPLRQWAVNARVVTGRTPSFGQRRAAQMSWFRNTIGSLQLGQLRPSQIQAAIEIDEQGLTELLRLHADQGLVLALPHMGSWDLAGAFGCVRGLPVTSVAERLPAGQYEYFRQLRARLGFEIYPYDHANLVATLADDIGRGRVICLVADRDFGRRGFQVRWPTPDGGRDLTVPVGPALIAQQSGAALVPLVCRFTGRRMHIELGQPIPSVTGTEGAREMSQQLVDFFAAQIAAYPTDWHMMQKFFPGELA